MTIKQKQHLLAFLGYYTGKIDGIWGKASTQATKDFQAAYGIEQDGIFGEETEKRIREVIGNDEQPKDIWAGIKYFRKEEFACKCGKHCNGYPVEIKEKLVKLADMVREHFDSPVIVSSGIRCETHNSVVGGVSNSRHLYGKAMDFCVSGYAANVVLDYVEKLPGINYAYAIDSNYVHMDIE